MTAARYWPVQSDAIEYQLLPGADDCVHVLPPIVIDDNYDRWSGIDKHDKDDDNNNDKYDDDDDDDNDDDDDDDDYDCNVLTKIGIIIAVVIN